MPVISKIDEYGGVVGEHDLTEALVEDAFNVGLVHEVVRAEFAAMRQGTSAAKSRGQVSGGGSKPWRQKGTGRARAGSTRVPHWTGGGVAFPPTPRSHEFKVNRKVRAKAYRMALGNLVGTEQVRVLSGVDFAEPSTRRAADILASSGLARPVLVLLASDELSVFLSFRNLAGVRALAVGDTEVQDYMWAKSLLLTEAALECLERPVAFNGTAVDEGAPAEQPATEAAGASRAEPATEAAPQPPESEATEAPAGEGAPELAEDVPAEDAIPSSDAADEEGEA
jgi:large subunit ribosomal protein L4